MNERSYAYHYRSLDSVRTYAERALHLSGHYEEGRAEALNNLAFVSIVKMDYDRAYQLLDSIKTDNLVELLVADVQYMRLCQRESKNRLFYDYSERAQRRLRRIGEELNRLNSHQLARFVYAQSEFYIIQSTYFYYVGLIDQSKEALAHIDPNGPVERDTAQLLNYLYNMGAGGLVEGPSTREIANTELNYLVRCCQIAMANGYPFFEAQATQAMSEHFEDVVFRNHFLSENAAVAMLINPDEMPDSLLAGYLAQRSLQLFADYGDVYQTAGAYRTLAECFWGIEDYQSAEICLLNALQKDTVINRAPDLVASIREQLSLVYSAIDDKAGSDFNRNIYLDMQEQTRQDRQLEARYDQLQRSSRQLNVMIAAVVAMIGLLLALLYVFHRMRMRNDRKFSIVSLLGPLEKWKREATEKTRKFKEHDEEIREQIGIAGQQLLENKKYYLEQRAKVSLVNSVMPFIDRIKHEVQRLLDHRDNNQVRRERYDYVVELTDKINDYNDVLTRWIQMRQGEVKLRVESFPLQELFDMVQRGRMSFLLKGIDLQVQKTDEVVKADKTLTLFMINTMADNARKFTPKGGRVFISSSSTPEYVEVSVADTGIGMDEEQLSNVFSHPTGSKSNLSNGFGLLNCKGIIEKYRKVSKIFNVCTIDAESEAGKGSRFYFRLPIGRQTLLALGMLFFGFQAVHADMYQESETEISVEEPLRLAGDFADSAYYSNINGTYERTLQFADNCIRNLNNHYRTVAPRDSLLMVIYDYNHNQPAELLWYKDGIRTNYDVIQAMRNEVAVAALALHRWDLYEYNNKAYTQLFRELSADNTLADYCRMMQKSDVNKNVAIIMLILLLLMIFPAYYLLYYRHRLAYRNQVERINNINEILLSRASAEEKLRNIDSFWKTNPNLSDSEFEELETIVSQIRTALQQNIKIETSLQSLIEQTEDELRKVQYENGLLHVSNNVLDNCLSTLKHETMYYPSHIRQLIDGTDGNLPAISELVAYYKELYSLLSMQAMRQMETPVRIDNDLVNYLFDIMRKHGGEKPVEDLQYRDDRYVRILVRMPQLRLSQEECASLFTPSTVDVDFLLCRQIVRDLGEATNARGCGIEAYVDDVTTIKLILTKQIWSHLK